MRNLVVILNLAFLLIASNSFGEDFDVTPEPLPTIDRAEIGPIMIDPQARHARIIILRGFNQDGVFQRVGGKEIELRFQDAPDNPNTPENDAVTDFTDLMNAMKLDKAGLRVFLKSKL